MSLKNRLMKLEDGQEASGVLAIIIVHEDETDEQAYRIGQD
jgi:hypothetical protein